MADSEQTFFQKITYTDGIYPLLKAETIQNPNRFFAFPLIGILIKIIILIPVLIEIWFIAIWWFIVVFLMNPLAVLFTGQYWQHAYQVTLVLLKLQTKVSFYMFGLTDKYPGFSPDINDNFNFDLAMPASSNRWFAIPFFGGIARIILLIPYSVFASIISTAASLGVVFLAWAVVLFKGKYPEGLFELYRDATRVALAQSVYIAGISDKYPSFYISMAHDKIKLILIAIAVIFQGWNFTTNFTEKEDNDLKSNPFISDELKQKLEKIEDDDKSREI